MLELKRLRLLWELHTRGTVAAVAESLNYSPSAVSQQLNQLEREAGAPLLRKSGRNLVLTATGEALVREAEELLNGLERAETVLRRSHPELNYTIRVAAFQSAMLAFLPETLRLLRSTTPQLRVELVQYEPELALRETWARRFDLVVAEQYPGHAAPHIRGLDRIPLTTDRIQLAVPRGRAFAHIRRIEDAAELPWVMEPVGAATRHWAEQACRRAGFEPDLQFETADLQAHVRLIESENAVALLPSLVHRGKPRVRLIDLEGQPRRELFTAARVASERDPAIAALRQALAQVVAQADPQATT